MFGHKTFWKLFLLLIAVVIGMGSLIYTESLVSKLKVEERKNVQLWAEATRLISLPDTSQNVEFLSTIIENNNTVPVILTDESDSIISVRNFDAHKSGDYRQIKKQLEKIKERNKPIVNNLENGHFNLIYYKDSIILTMLIYYPYIQLGIIIFFILVSYLAFRSSRKAEQNQVWVGMSKETAHQLGTPTSSLAGWIEILEQKHPGISITKELALDVQRLEKVTERFSRIGSKPAITSDNIIGIISRTIDYLKLRTSSKVKIITDYNPDEKVVVPINAALFEWVIENVFKNAVDSMEGSGELTIRITQTEKHALIDISDTERACQNRPSRKYLIPGLLPNREAGVWVSLWQKG